LARSNFPICRSYVGANSFALKAGGLAIKHLQLNWLLSVGRYPHRLGVISNQILAV